MREFILRARKAKTNSDINMNELPKEGKMDAVCATIANALWISGAVRQDTVIHVVLEGPTNGPKTISFSGNGIRGLYHDERAMASYIAAALQRGAWLKLNEETKVRAGVRIAKKSFEKLVWEKSNEYKQIIVLDQNGTDIRKFDLKKDFVVIFGSAEGLPPKTEKFLKDLKAEKVSLGPKMLFAAHCPIIIHNEADRRG
ncbi:MAG: tRNA (pseudouridine(54)-N(1))-methyltransferase TrmY [Candidatus Aenigmarchaeota archaeon]|nr:tRNA (pseudouridine(54)-N(1))-methyltransferase TrmY [Candidatus Aenigmarchaeota archaeon]